MAPRASWKGYLKLSLVSCSVALFPANTTRERISFHQLNRETGNRLRQQMVDEDTGEVVETEDRVKGYEVGKDEYVVVEPEELDEIRLESTHTIEIDTFVPRSEIDPIYLDGSHYLAPEDKVSEEAFSVIREAMREEDVVGIGRVVMQRRERILLIEPRGKGLLATTLHFKNEVRDDAAYFDEIQDVKIDPEMLDLAGHIIETKSGHFAPEGFEDRYEEALTELIRAKQQGKPAPVRKEEKPEPVSNLMEALRRSIASEKADTTRRAPAGSKARREATKPAGRSRPEPRPAARRAGRR